jgi:hypothetical protein
MEAVFVATPAAFATSTNRGRRLEVIFFGSLRIFIGED